MPKPDIILASSEAVSQDLQSLKALSFACVVLDMRLRVRGLAARAQAALQELGPVPHRVLLLGGANIKGGPYELFGMLSCVRPELQVGQGGEGREGHTRL